MPASLLDDIEEEHHQHLLKNGNLLPKKREVSWSDENSWISQGYIARVITTKCRCGSSTESLVGILHREKTPSGKIREQALDLQTELQFPRGNLTTIRSTSKTSFCPVCLSVYGFSTAT